jgi:LmbE family N-acetylglucosaminyl deacetylase
MRVLVIASHPDDEVLGCGATIARHCDAGDEVTIVVLGEGATSRSPDERQVNERRLACLHDEAQQAASVLGTSDLRLLQLPDNRFDTVPLLHVVQLLEPIVDEIAPEVVYCQHGGDLNVDHQVTFRAALTATRPVPGSPVKSVLSFEVNSSSEWSFGAFAPIFQPSVFVDVSATIDRKLEALARYRSELRSFPHPRSLEAVRARATCWGATVGVNAAEAFVPVRELR